MIEEEGREELLKLPPKANVLVVREFYANTPIRESQEVMVRGKIILCDAKSINGYNHLDKEQALNHYKNFLKELNLDEILKFLINGRGVCKQNMVIEEKHFTNSTLTTSSKL